KALFVEIRCDDAGTTADLYETPLSPRPETPGLICDDEPPIRGPVVDLLLASECLDMAAIEIALPLFIVRTEEIVELEGVVGRDLHLWARCMRFLACGRGRGKRLASKVRACRRPCEILAALLNLPKTAEGFSAENQPPLNEVPELIKWK